MLILGHHYIPYHNKNVLHLSKSDAIIIMDFYTQPTIFFNNSRSVIVDGVEKNGNTNQFQCIVNGFVFCNTKVPLRSQSK